MQINQNDHEQKKVSLTKYNKSVTSSKIDTVFLFILNLFKTLSPTLNAVKIISVPNKIIEKDMFFPLFC